MKKITFQINWHIFYFDEILMIFFILNANNYDFILQGELKIATYKNLFFDKTLGNFIVIDFMAKLSKVFHLVIFALIFHFNYIK